MPLMRLPAHYDGEQVRLDESVVLPANTRLTVTVLEEANAERDGFLRLASSGLARAYSEDEVEYTEADLK
jgi:hypothetical protein